ncbi:MAG: CHAT domain-containing protein, partial [Symploca sp. SIO2C1]|nr:CHAT domain-containing protein [Symploca sp. SIO2C1]
SKEAIASLDQAIQIKPDWHEAWQSRGWVLLYRLRRFSKAIISFDKALEIRSDNHYAWYDHGWALAHLGRYEEAIESYDQAIQIKPDWHEVWYSRGLALNSLGQYEEGIVSCEKAIELKPNEHLYWHNKGVVLNHLGRFSEALVFLDKAIEINPNNNLAWGDRGLVLFNLKQYEEALVSYDKAIEINPNNNLVWGKRGVVLFHLEQYEEAIVSCNKTIENNPNNNSAWLNRGSALDKEVLQDLIRTLLALEAIDQAQEFQRRGTDVLHNLLKNTKSPAKKKQLALKFAPFQQLTVDLAVQSGDAVQALELAEAGKNACLSLLLAGRNNEFSSPTWEQIKQLLNPTTAIVYWHISPAALHTFILKHDYPLPIVLGQTKLTEKNQFLPQIQRLRDFETWVKEWNQDYRQYRQKKNKPEDNHWWDNLCKMLKRLAKILDIPAIVNILQTSPICIQNLILIPHRDLHRFPLHALFNRDENGQNFTISYLPSAQFSLKPTVDEEPASQQLLSVEVPTSKNLPPLSFVAFEAEAITQLFEAPERIQEGEATKERVEAALENRPLAKIFLTPPQPSPYQGEGVVSPLYQGGTKGGNSNFYKRSNKHQIFHFAGHGSYNFAEPLNSELALVDEELTLREIYKKNLATYQLVSLSACETAITGNQTITTEYVGLVSGFLSREVSQVVSTLWTVKSAATALVMIEFYRRWQAGKSEVQALAEATDWLKNRTVKKLSEWYQAFLKQLPPEKESIRPFIKHELRKLAKLEPNKKRYEHPYYWAAFIITGKI